MSAGAAGVVAFETVRLRARRIAEPDVDKMLAVYGDPEVVRFVGDGEPLDRAGCQRWVEVTLENYRRRGYGMLALESRTDGSVVGFCGLVHPNGQVDAEIKYAFLRSCWGRGYASEVAPALLAWGVAVHGLRRVIATVDPAHEASQRVLARAGMSRGALRADDDGGFTQLFVWEAVAPPG